MPISEILNHFKDSAATALRTGEQLSDDISKSASHIIWTLENGGKILICGNGGSAADALHFSAELVVRFERDRPALAAIALSADTAAITATGNDFDFNQIFARQVEALGRTDDHLVVISTSGNSENISAAVIAAKNISNMRITALTGRDGGALKTVLGREDVELRVPSESTARIQEAHAIIIHVLCTLVDNHFA